MSGDHDELLALAAPYVLGALDPAEQREFEAHLSGCAACAAEVRSLRPVIGSLARAVPERTPSLSLRERVLSSIRAGAGADVPSPDLGPGQVRSSKDGQRPDRSNARAGAALGVGPSERIAWLPIAALLMLTAGIGAYATRLNARIGELEVRLEQALLQASAADRVMAEARRVALEAQSAMAVLAAPDLARIDLAGQKTAPQARARALWSRERGMVFTASNLPPLPAGRVYQVWVLPATQGAPISAGLLTPDAEGRGSAFFQTPSDIPAPKAVAVTLEPAGGVPAPTTEPFLVGTPAAGL